MDTSRYVKDYTLEPGDYVTDSAVIVDLKGGPAEPYKKFVIKGDRKMTTKLFENDVFTSDNLEFGYSEEVPDSDFGPFQTVITEEAPDDEEYEDASDKARNGAKFVVLYVSDSGESQNVFASLLNPTDCPDIYEFGEVIEFYLGKDPNGQNISQGGGPIATIQSVIKEGTATPLTDEQQRGDVLCYQFTPIEARSE